MRRREFIALVGAAAVGAAAWRPGARSEQAKKIPRIGFLANRFQGHVAPFRQGLGELGYVEGVNILVEYREAEGRIERLPALASELVDLGVDLIVATNSLAARAVQQATATIPIVVPAMADPVGDGFVASLARPGGNITGLTFLGPELLPKLLALLKEALPAASRIAGLWHPRAYGENTMKGMLKETEAAARTLDVSLQLVAVQGPDDFDRAFAEVGRERVDALIVYPSSMLFTERTRIMNLATEHRLPSMATGREFVELGGLMAYGASIPNLHRQAGGLRGQNWTTARIRSKSSHRRLDDAGRPL